MTTTEVAESSNSDVSLFDKDELSKAVGEIVTSGFPLAVRSFQDDEGKVRRFCYNLQKICNISSDFVVYDCLYPYNVLPQFFGVKTERYTTIFLFLSKKYERWIASLDFNNRFVRCFLLDKFEKQPLPQYQSVDISDTENRVIPYVIAKEIVSAAKRVKEEERIRKESLLTNSMKQITFIAVDVDSRLVHNIFGIVTSLVNTPKSCLQINSAQMMVADDVRSRESNICLWFLGQIGHQNEELINHIKMINRTTPIMLILLQKCDISSLTEIELLDVSEAKAEDVPIMIAQALLQYDNLKIKWIMQKFEDEQDLKQIMTEDGVFSQVYSDLLTTGGLNSVELLLTSFNWLEKMKVCLKYIHQDDRILDDVEASFREKRNDHISVGQSVSQKKEKDLHYCVVKNDLIGILELLQKTKYPNQGQLKELFETFGRKHPLTKFAYMRICKFIKEENSKVVDVWPAYEMKANGTSIQVGDIRLVVEMEEGTEQINLQNIYVQTIQRHQKAKMQKSEHKVVIDHAYDCGIRLTGSDISRIGKVINKEISRMRQQHRNLIMIAASPIKSTGYKTTNHQMRPGNCIVLLVSAKGLIPLHENSFPKQLGDFEIDVRDGDCKLAVGGGPHQRHNDGLKMGCAIGVLGGQKYGTLGGFMKTCDFELCALTCCHVTSTEYALQTFNRGISYTGVERKCVQPNEHDEHNVFGYTVKNCFDGEQGVDATLIKIHKRFPTGGSFPDCTSKELELAGITASMLSYTSGKIESINKANFDRFQDMILVKYGATTTLKRGRLAAFDIPAWAPVRFSEKLSVTFLHQIEINDIKECGTFAEEGDSGSLVFLSTKNGLVAIGMIMAVTGNGVTYVNPIHNVLDALKCTLYTTMPDTKELICEAVTKAKVEKDKIKETLNDDFTQQQ